MDKIPISIKKTIDEYLYTLKNNNIPIQHAILFGSYANGNYTGNSDIDIALVSDFFDGIRFLDRKKIIKITLKVSKEIEPLPFNPKQFTIDDPFVREIIETGINLV